MQYQEVVSGQLPEWPKNNIAICLELILLILSKLNLVIFASFSYPISSDNDSSANDSDFL